MRSPRSWRTTRRVSRVPYLPLRNGDRVSVVTGGGGGYGDPRRRPLEDIAADVRNGYLTPERARKDYGVGLAPDGRILEPAAARAGGE